MLPRGKKKGESRRGFWQRLLERLFSPPFDRAWIEEEVLTDICTLAQSAAPKEVIAFLTGTVQREGKERVLVINGLYIKGYYADHNSASVKLIDLPLLDVYGTVHSHPSRNNRPSREDKALFSKFGWFHMIIGAPYTPDKIAVYDKHGRPLGAVPNVSLRADVPAP